MNEAPPTVTGDDPAGLRYVRQHLTRLEVTPNRVMGQNFLVNRQARDRIVAAAELGPHDAVLEMGPGLGALTWKIVSQAGCVTAIEKDARLVPALAGLRCHVIRADAITISWDQLQLPARGVKTVANLPYSAAKPLLRRLLEEWREHLDLLVVTVQQEVADRLLAAPATPDYGPLAIMTALHWEAALLLRLAPGSFFPAPTVQSAVVRLRRMPTPPVTVSDPARFWGLVQAAFRHRRKQLGHNLPACFSSKARMLQALEACGVDPARRGETLTLPELAALSRLPL